MSQLAVLITIGVVLKRQHKVFCNPLKKNRTYSCFTQDTWVDFKRAFPCEVKSIQLGSIIKKDGNYYLNVEQIRKIPLISNSEAYDVILKHRVVKPRDCLFAFGIPTNDSLGSLFMTEFNNIKSDYLKRAGSPLLYKEKVLKPVKSFIKFLKKIHVTVKENVTIEDLASFFKADYQVIFLYTHYIDKVNMTYDTNGSDGVELGMQFIPLDNLIAAIPQEYVNTFDLCVCNAGPAGIRLRVKRPNCSLRYLRKEVNPSEWMLIYRFMLNLIKIKDLSYRDAALATTRYLARYYYK